MHKNGPQNFARPKGRKTQKCTRKSLKKAEPGAFWVLEGMGTIENGSNQMRKPSVRTRMNPIPMQHMKKENRRKPSVFAGFLAGAEGLGLGCRLGRLVACVPPARTRPTTRTAQGAAAPRCRALMPTNEKSQVPHKRYLTFLAGAEGLEPSARGFGVDVGERSQERGRGDVSRFPPQVTKQAVLVWCCEHFWEAEPTKSVKMLSKNSFIFLAYLSSYRTVKYLFFY